MSKELWILIGVVIAIVVFSIILSIASFSSERFMQIYTKANSTPAKTDLNILDFVHNLNHFKLNGKIKIAQTDNDVDNFYVSKTKTVALSRETLTSNSIASFSIVAHEMGHALQDKEGNKLKSLNILRRLGNFIGYLFLPALLAGIVLLILGNDFFFYSIIAFSIGGGIFLLAVLIKAITIGIEKDASNKGLEFLEEILDANDMRECRKLLNAARLTYWGDLFRLLFSWTFLTRKTKMFRN